MNALDELLQQFSARYHKPLVARAALLAGLGSGCCALLAWRLTALKFGAGKSFGIAGGLVVVWFALLALWLRSRWLPPKETAAYLDDALGLKQRLVTAEEFAQTPGRSPLYTDLVSDLSGRVSTNQLKTPRSLDHTTGLLAVALLLLLLWPQLNPVLPPSLRLPEKQPPQLKEQSSAQNPQEPPQQQQPQSSAQQKSAAGNQPQPPSGQQQSGQGASQNQPGQSGQNDSSHSAQPQPLNNSSGSGQSQPNATSAQQNQPGSRKNAQPGTGASGQSAGSTEQTKASAGSQQAPTSSTAENSAAKADASQGQNPPASTTASPQQSTQAYSTANPRAAGQQQPAKASAQPSGRPGSQSNDESSRAQQSMQGQKQESPSAREGSGTQGLGQSPGNTAELKADIQQLLKEMSGELKGLQRQWEAQNQDRPQAGSGTDPNLYGDAEKLDALSGKSPSPLEMEADEKPTSKSGRRAGGTGKASGDILSAAPQAKPEQAQLADQPAEEGAVSRQPVPAEYRNVFDQLRRGDAQPSGGQKP